MELSQGPGLPLAVRRLDANCRRGVGKSCLMKNCAAQMPRVLQLETPRAGEGAKVIWDRVGICPQALWLPGTVSGRQQTVGGCGLARVPRWPGGEPVPGHRMWSLGVKERTGGQCSREADPDNSLSRRIRKGGTRLIRAQMGRPIPILT